MKYLNDIGRFLVYGNAWVALCAAAQGVLTFQLIGAKVSYAVLAVLFSATFFVYNLRVFFDLKPSVPSAPLSFEFPLPWMEAHAGILRATSVLLLLVTLPLALQLTVSAWIVLFFTGLLAMAYFLPLVYSKGLRQLPGLKTFLIGAVWALSTVLLPVVQAEDSLSGPLVALLLIKRFLIAFTLALVFDIRDEETDRKEHLHTLVTYLGGHRARQIGVGLLWLDLLLTVLLPLPFTFSLLPAVLISTLCTSAVVWYASRLRHAFYFLFVSDGMLMVRFILISFALNMR